MDNIFHFRWLQLEEKAAHAQEFILHILKYHFYFKCSELKYKKVAKLIKIISTLRYEILLNDFTNLTLKL